MALGAQGSSIVGLVVARGVRLGAIGVIVGLLGAWLSGRFLESLVYGIGTADVATLAGVGVLLGSSVVIASAVPALRSLRVSPLRVLRSE
jgi:ABC-type antimicrobial peptide transport system permease subunit